MKSLASILPEASPGAIGAVGRYLLWAGFGLTMLLVILTAWLEGTAVLIWPALFLAPVIIGFLFARPLLNLVVVLSSFALIADYQEGIQLIEVVYGLYMLGFLGHWFFTRVALYKEDILAAPEDKAILFFLVGVTASIPLTFLFGGKFVWVVSEWSALVLIAFYFPVKEACIRYRNGAWVMLIVLFLLGLFASVRNMIIYQHALSSAEYAWQVARGRVYFNDIMIMVNALAAFALLTYARKVKVFLPAFALFVVLSIGLVLTQSRGMWMAFIFGASVLFFFVGKEEKRRIVLFGSVALVSFSLVAVVFFGEYVDLIVAGLLGRFASIGTAAQEDISLINRFRESSAVFAMIVKNPILGYGMGVPYHFFDLAHMATDKDAFAHNGYLLLWYKFGIWGLAFVLYAWYRSARAGLRAVRLSSVSSARVPAFAAAVALVALTLAANTSNPFFLMDGTILFGMLTGLAAGGFHRAKRDLSDHDLQRRVAE